jgi:hypothetical protein
MRSRTAGNVFIKNAKTLTLEYLTYKLSVSDRIVPPSASSKSRGTSNPFRSHVDFTSSALLR